MLTKIMSLSRQIVEKTVLTLKAEQYVYYINGPEKLLPPLTSEEERVVFAGLKSGDNASRDLLIVHNLRLVVYISKKFDQSGNIIEDLISIGTIGLIKAVGSFNPDKNIKFATYATRCIENEILMYLRKIGNKKLETSIDEALNIDADGNELHLSDVLVTDQDIVGKQLETADEKNTLLLAVKRLPDKERTIIEMRFGLFGHEEKTQKEVADLLGISQSYISRLEKKIIKNLRDELEQLA